MDARRIENLEVGVNEIVLKLNEIGKILASIQGPVFPWVQPPPQTKEEFLKHLNDLIKENGLADLYPPGDPRLDRLAQKAADRLKDPFTDGFVDTPEDVVGLVEASLYDHIMFCDDSGSMKIDNRKGHLETLIGRVARVTSYLDNDGVSVRFINYTNDAGFNGLTTIDEIIAIIKSVPFEGSTRLGTKLLEKVVNPMIIAPVNNKTLKRPVLVTIVTDGEPNEEPANALQTTILKCIEALTRNGYNPRSVRFQISQVGNAEAAKNFLLALQNDKDIKGNIHVTAEKIDVQLSALNANHQDLERWVLSYLLAPIRIR